MPQPTPQDYLVIIGQQQVRIVYLEQHVAALTEALKAAQATAGDSDAAS